MALSKSYYTVGGEILAERTPAGGRMNYGVDALGSVTSTLVGDAVQNRYAYKPYGGELSRSGAGSDPGFRWVGTLGYRQTGRSYCESYVRARHYAQTLGRWANSRGSVFALSVYGTMRSNPIADSPLGSQGTCDLSLIPSYKIGWVDVQSPDAGNCGAWGVVKTWRIRWRLATLRSQTSQDGWIIQEIDNPAVNMVSCKTGVAPCTRARIHYYEGWWTSGQQVEVTSSFKPTRHVPVAPGDWDDEFGDSLACSCHNGSKFRSGWAKFQPADKGCWQNWGWTDGNPNVDPRGVLLGGQAPQGWSRSGTAVRHFEAIANCCDRVLDCMIVVGKCVTRPTSFH